MKKMSLLLLFAVFGLVGCEKETIILANNLPAEIQSYLSTHFPSNEVIQIIKDRDGLSLTYDVILQGNFMLEFNRKKEVIDIDGQSKLPDSVIPVKLLEFVQTNYSDNFITHWEIEGKNQQIQLDNGLELIFTTDGRFLKIDD